MEKTKLKLDITELLKDKDNLTPTKSSVRVACENLEIPPLKLDKIEFPSSSNEGFDDEMPETTSRHLSAYRQMQDSHFAIPGIASTKKFAESVAEAPFEDEHSY